MSASALSKQRRSRAWLCAMLVWTAGCASNASSTGGGADTVVGFVADEGSLYLTTLTKLLRGTGDPPRWDKVGSLSVAALGYCDPVTFEGPLVRGTEGVLWSLSTLDCDRQGAVPARTSTDSNDFTWLVSADDVADGVPLSRISALIGTSGGNPILIGDVGGVWVFDISAGVYAQTGSTANSLAPPVSCGQVLAALARKTVLVSESQGADWTVALNITEEDDQLAAIACASTEGELWTVSGYGLVFLVSKTQDGEWRSEPVVDASAAGLMGEQQYVDGATSASGEVLAVLVGSLSEPAFIFTVSMTGETEVLPPLPQGVILTSIERLESGDILGGGTGFWRLRNGAGTWEALWP